MDASTEQLLKVITIFCMEFDIEPPKTNNIREWWKAALEQMDIEVIEIINEAFVVGGSHILKGMRDDILVRRNEVLAINM